MNVVITGTAQGIGLELTRKYLSEGHRVLATHRPGHRGPALASLQLSYADNLLLAGVDVAQEGAGEEILHFLKDWSCVDLLINNAGIYPELDSASDFIKAFEINSIAPYLITKKLLPKLKASALPKVANISSQMGSISDNSSGGSHAYRASKAALNMIVKGLAMDERWLTVITLHPGWVQTRMGGEAAPVTAQESALGLAETISQVTASQSGKFFNYLGAELNW